MKFKRITKMLTNEQLFRIFIKNGFSKGERENKKFTFDKPKRGSRKPKRVGNIISLT